MSIGDPIAEAVAAVPDRTALLVDGRAISYRHVGDSVGKAAANLTARGVEPGDRIALADACGLSAVAGTLGAARIGAAAAAMSPALTSEELAALVRAAGCTFGLAGAEVRDRLAAAMGVDPIGEQELLSDQAVRGPEVVPEGDAVAVVLFTGGTTGVPKPIPITHATLEARVRSFAAPPDLTAEPIVTIVCVPFHHVAGLVGVLVGLAGGSTIVVQRRFDAGEWLRLVSEHRVARAFLVPAMLHRILDHPSFGTTDLSSLAVVTYGAAPASAALIDRALSALPQVGFVNVFGQTETLGAVTALAPDDHRAGRSGSVGRPLPGVEIRIVDPATQREGDEGELWVRAAHTAQPGWVRTGDLVRRRPDGFLYATGRLSDLINRGGEKIAPAEVEEALRLHPLVADAAVAGFPDTELGERVGAVVVARGRVDVAAMRAWCRDRLAAYKVPERIRFVEELPRTELGKVSRTQLAGLLAELR